MEMKGRTGRTRWKSDEIGKAGKSKSDRAGGNQKWRERERERER